MWSSGPERWWLTLVVAAAAPAKSTETSRKCHSFGASLERFFLTEARCALRARVQSFRGQNQLKPGREYPGNHHHRRIRSFPARNHDGVGIRKRSTTRGQSNDRNVRYATFCPSDWCHAFGRRRLSLRVSGSESLPHRSEAGAATARRLYVGARQQHAAALQLLAHLGDDHGPGRQRPNAVLVVDDYGDVREVLAGVLEDAGFVVRTAANRLEA
jgi:hypothetical protein